MGATPGLGGHSRRRSQQQEARAAQLPVHPQEPLGGGGGAGLALLAELVPQGPHLPQQRLQGQWGPELGPATPPRGRLSHTHPA